MADEQQGNSVIIDPSKDVFLVFDDRTSAPRITNRAGMFLRKVAPGETVTVGKVLHWANVEGIGRVVLSWPTKALGENDEVSAEWMGNDWRNATLRVRVHANA